MYTNIPKNALPRVLIVGGGFAGLKLAQSLDRKRFQIVLVDRNNYHQFPPLIYQVASSGLEPSSIAFPFRSLFRKNNGFYFRMADLLHVDTKCKQAVTSIGRIDYDYLVLACGATTNYFGNEHLARHTLPMKTLDESMNLRNVLLRKFEEAICSDTERQKELLNICIVGGGPTGVEISGALAEMKRYVIPKDFPELDINMLRITLIDASPRILAAMSEKSSATARKDLIALGVDVRTELRVLDYDGETLALSNGETLRTKTVIWVSGVIAKEVQGIPAEVLGRGKRILVNAFNEINGQNDVYAIGDQCLMTTDPAYPNGHSQMAQVALQQAKLLAENLKRSLQQKPPRPFLYQDLGAMATIGRNKAVAEIGKLKWGGFSAWVLWLIVHLRSILSVRNKIVVLLNWMWNYFTYGRSLRLILKSNTKSSES